MDIADKNAIFHATRCCKKRSYLISEIVELQNMEINLLQISDIKYLTKTHMQNHPFIILKILYWFSFFIMSIFVFYYTISKQLLYNDFLLTQNLWDFIALLLSKTSVFYRFTTLLFVYIITYILLLCLRKIKVKKKCQQLVLVHKEEVNQIRKKLIDLNQQLEELNTYMSNPDNCMLPPTYWDVGNKIEEYILNLRAHTLTEAINLYEAEKLQKIRTK